MDLKSTGKISLSSDEHFDEICITGKLTSSCSIGARTISVTGNIDVDKDISVERTLNVTGKATAKSFSADTFSATGKVTAETVTARLFDIRGSIDADSLEAKIINWRNTGRSQVHIIRSDNVKINSGSQTNESITVSLGFMKFSVNSSTNDAEPAECHIGKIEALSVDLTDVTAEEVTCENLVLRGKSHVKNVRSTKNVTINDDSVIDHSEVVTPR
jgi:cytoskeletal protein CcmA (bactofilin family)